MTGMGAGRRHDPRDHRLRFERGGRRLQGPGDRFGKPARTSSTRPTSTTGASTSSTTRSRNSTCRARSRTRQIPANFAPFGIQAIGPKIYVTYAQQDSDAHDDVAGPDLVSSTCSIPAAICCSGSNRGCSSTRRGAWRMAPGNFGTLSNDILVGNFGDGTIHAFDPTSGKFVGTVTNPDGSRSSVRLVGPRVRQRPQRATDQHALFRGRSESRSRRRVRPSRHAVIVRLERGFRLETGRVRVSLGDVVRHQRAPSGSRGIAPWRAARLPGGAFSWGSIRATRLARPTPPRATRG